VLILAALVATGIFVTHALRKDADRTSLSECKNGVHLELAPSPPSLPQRARDYR
jgi:hypothetical protein